MNNGSFVLYDNYIEQIRFLSDEQAGVLLKAIYAYRNGENIPLMDAAVNMAFSFIRSKLEQDRERYEETCRKRREAGLAGGAPKGNKNAKKQLKQPKQAKQPNACCDGTVEDTEDCGWLEKQLKQPKQAKQPDNEYEYDNDYDIKEKSTYVLKKKSDERTDERESKQREFFDTYPGIIIDNYSTSDYAQIDFDVLLKEFALSKKCLCKIKSFSWVCSNYRKIANGGFRDWDIKSSEIPEEIDEAAERQARAKWYDEKFGDQ